MPDTTVVEVIESGSVVIEVIPQGVSPTGSAAWGTITGTLADQTDLQAALDGKSGTGHTHPVSALTQSGATTGQVLIWNGSAWAPGSISPGGSSGQVQYNNAGAFGGMPLGYTAGTGLLEYAPAWNNGATAFTAFRVNPTDTASDNASRLLALQVGGVDRMFVTKRGNVRWDHVSGSWATIDDGLSVGASSNRDVIVGPAVSGISMRQGQQIQFSSDASDAYFDRSGLTMQRATNGGLSIYTGHTYVNGAPMLTLNSLNSVGSNADGTADRGWIRFQQNGVTSGTIGVAGGKLNMTGVAGLNLGAGAYHQYGDITFDVAGMQFAGRLFGGFDSASYAAFNFDAGKSAGGAITAGDIVVAKNGGGAKLWWLTKDGRMGYSATASTPSNTSTPVTWAEFFIGTTSYRLPLYQ